ncbi:MAG: Spy/CpxP family protein refolding chaperone [Burkholderiales bacterium]|nr:Spy/CpxP family protein refolding chaperone [Burkholderiales bacterium]
MNKFCKSLLLGATAFGISLGTIAAPGDKAPEGKDGAASAMMGRPHEGKFREHFAKRQAELHDKLKLNAGQEAAWKTYITALTPAERPARPDKAQWEKLTAPERMEKMLERLKQAEVHLTNAIAATKTFYATLTPEQKKIFDDNVAKGPMHRHGHRGAGAPGAR